MGIDGSYLVSSISYFPYILLKSTISNCSLTNGIRRYLGNVNSLRSVITIRYLLSSQKYRCFPLWRLQLSRFIRILAFDKIKDQANRLILLLFS